MRFQAGIQIILLITAGVIVFTVIKPKFESIRQTQAEVADYRDAVASIGQYNQKLQELMNQASAIPAEDLAALYRYLPEEVDAVAVARDISNIVNSQDLLLVDVIPDDPEEIVTETSADSALADPNMVVDPAVPADPDAFVEGSNETNALKMMSQKFDVSVVGTYEDMKLMLQDLERNDYPLRVIEFSFTLDEENSDLVEYSLILETYSLSR